jgi:hypothetical protein
MNSNTNIKILMDLMKKIITSKIGKFLFIKQIIKNILNLKYKIIIIRILKIWI